MATTDVPALTPPEGVKANFIDPHTLMPAVIAAATVINIFTLPFILARLYVNIVIAKKVRVEDALSYLAYVGCIAYTVLVVHTSAIGMARHMWDIPIPTFTNILFLTNVIFICYTATGGLAKMVVFLQLKNFFTTRQRGVVFWVIMGSLAANAVFYTAMFLLYIFT